jgi:para-nitrobenzyl esterase
MPNKRFVAVGQKTCVAGLACLAAVGSVAWADTPPPRLSPSLRLDNGLLWGQRQGDTEAFLGLPYAQPPTGDWRWRAPRPALPLQGVRDATQPGPVCMQPPAPRGPEAVLAKGPMSEDCLTLNVWRPAARAEHALPIVVWLHGGAFRIGAGSLGLYNGQALAAQQAVVVTLNYRLGPLGFLAHPALRQAGEPGVNHGLLDQIAALRWVKAHARQLGGDPDRITLMGESAGGASVAYLMASPLARGLFQRAIVQSGALDLPEASRADGEQRAQAVLTPAVGAQPSAEALRQMPAAALLALPWRRTDTMPMVDGEVLPQGMRAAFRSGAAQALPLLIGSNDAESAFFPPAWSQAVVPQFGAAWPTVAQAVPLPASATEAQRAQRVATDVFATGPTWQVAQAHAARAPVYLYRYAHVAPARRATQPGAMHTAELPYLFGQLDADQRSDADVQHATALQRSWLAFVRTGRPAPDAAGTPWPPLDPARPQAMWWASEGPQLRPVPDQAWLQTLAGYPDVHAN